jgi:hypothetical protein
MLLKYSYFYFPNALTIEQCQKIIELGNSKVLEEGTTFGNNEKGKNLDKASLGDKLLSEVEDKSKYYIRNSQIAWISEKWVYDLILPFIQKANILAGWKFDIDWYESLQFTKYHEKGAFYGWHKDGGGDWNDIYKKEIPGVTPSNSTNRKYNQDIKQTGKVRKLSATISLNTGYTGGDLKFDFGPNSTQRFGICEEVRKPGTICVFPSFIDHCVTPIENGERYSLVCWCLGRPFK